MCTIYLVLTLEQHTSDGEYIPINMGLIIEPQLWQPQAQSEYPQEFPSPHH